MSSAHVRDVDAIKSFRVALVKFIEGCSVALAEADGDVARTLNWLETQQVPFWALQIRKREELVSRCQDAVRQKTLYKDSLGRPQSAIEEMKALKKAHAVLEVARQKHQMSRSYVGKLQRQQQEYRGGVAKLQMNLAGELPEVVVRLGNMVDLIEQYGTTEKKAEATSSAVSSTEEMKPAKHNKSEADHGTV
jgi:hypothetical protein